MRPIEPPLLAADRIRERVAALAGEIDAAYAGRRLIVVCVLKGALPFAADLLRQLTVDVEVEFIRARSYARNQSTGTVELPWFPDRPLTGKHVLVVEDILDSGRTTQAICDHFERQGPASLSLCVLLDKAVPRAAPVRADFVGFAIEDRFVVGYGLDYEERYRQLPHIHVLEDV